MFPRSYFYFFLYFIWILMISMVIVDSEIYILVLFSLLFVACIQILRFRCVGCDRLLYSDKKVHSMPEPSFFIFSSSCKFCGAKECKLDLFGRNN